MDAVAAPDTAAAPTPMPIAGQGVFHQPFNILAPDGTIFTTSTDDVNRIRVTTVQTAIVFSSQLGACLVLLLVLLLMTSPAKRKSAAFIFNALALLCNVIRCVIMCVELTGPLLDFVVLLMQFYEIDGINQAIRESIADSVMATLVFIFIELALLTQVWVICLATTKQHRALVLGFCGTVSVVAIAFRIRLMVVNCANTANLMDYSVERAHAQNRAQWLSNIMGVISICVFSAIFCGKLALAIRSRRSMGLKQFGAMQIIFIMGCQTLFIPCKSESSRSHLTKLTFAIVIFAILDYYVIKGSQIGSFVETFVAIFLPLSSMWASANVNSKHVAMPNEHHANHRAIPVGHSEFTEADEYYNSKKVLLTDDTRDSSGEHGSSSYSASPSKYDKQHEPRSEPRISANDGHRASYISDVDDLEMQKLARGIHVDRSYTVRSDPHSEVGRAR